MQDMLDGKTSTPGHDASTAPASHAQWMLHGTQQHAAGQLEQALIAFENALSIEPDDVNAASACATLLTLLDRPQAAYKTLLTVEPLLMLDADGATNLAIAAETCGDLGKAHVAYNRALELAPEHLRAMNNVALLAAAGAQWDIAIGLAGKCLAAQPLHPPHHVNLSDFHLGAGHPAAALEVAAKGAAQFPDHADLKTRHIALLAINGEFEKSDALIKQLDGATRRSLAGLLARLSAAGTAQQTPQLPPPDPDRVKAFQFYLVYTLKRMQDCDWENNAALAQFIKAGLTVPLSGGTTFDYGLTLDLSESEQTHMEAAAATALRASAGSSLTPLTARRKTGLRKDDPRIHVGFMPGNSADPLEAGSLRQQLATHDTAGFAIHVYLTGGQPGQAQTDALRTHAASVVQISHMSDAELAGRIRLDQLDVFVQGDAGAAWHRPAVASMRVAPVQLRQPGWHRHQLAGVFDYVVSDTFIHPDGLDTTAFGAVVRLPRTCWLATHGTGLPVAAPDRQAAGLPSDAFVLCSSTLPEALDPQTFALWMKMLRMLPDAILWLPGCGAAAANNLVREAEAAGVNANRLLFSRPDAPIAALCNLQHADLFVDNLRFNTAQGVEAALRSGLPVISCAGNRMASRMGGSLLQATGMADCVAENPAAWVAEVVRLGRNPDALLALRERLNASRVAAPLFDLAARIREWESAWREMVERSRSGLTAASFDVPASGSAKP